MTQNYTVSFRQKRGRPARCETETVHPRKRSDFLGILREADQITPEQYTAAILYQTLYLQAQQVSESPQFVQASHYLTNHAHLSMSWENEQDFLVWKHRKQQIWESLHSELGTKLTHCQVSLCHDWILGHRAGVVATLPPLRELSQFLEVVGNFLQGGGQQPPAHRMFEVLSTRGQSAKRKYT